MLDRDATDTFWRSATLAFRARWHTPWRMSERTRQIIQLVGEGYDNKVIGAEMDLPQRAVRSYLTRIYKQCGVGELPQKYGLMPRVMVARLYWEMLRAQKRKRPADEEGKEECSDT